MPCRSGPGSSVGSSSNECAHLGVLPPNPPATPPLPRRQKAGRCLSRRVHAVVHTHGLSWDTRDQACGQGWPGPREVPVGETGSSPVYRSEEAKKLPARGTRGRGARRDCWGQPCRTPRAAPVIGHRSSPRRGSSSRSIFSASPASPVTALPQGFAGESTLNTPLLNVLCADGERRGKLDGAAGAADAPRAGCARVMKVPDSRGSARNRTRPVRMSPPAAQRDPEVSAFVHFAKCYLLGFRDALVSLICTKREHLLTTVDQFFSCWGRKGLKSPVQRASFPGQQRWARTGLADPDARSQAHDSALATSQPLRQDRTRVDREAPLHFDERCWGGCTGMNAPLSLPPRAWHLLKPDLGQGHRLQLRADAGDKAHRCQSPSAERGQEESSRFCEIETGLRRREMGERERVGERGVSDARAPPGVRATLGQDGFRRESRTCCGLAPPASCGLPYTASLPCVSIGTAVVGTTGRGGAAARPPPDRHLILKCQPETRQSCSASARPEFDGGILTAALGGLSREQPSSQMGEWGSETSSNSPKVTQLPMRWARRHRTVRSCGPSAPLSVTLTSHGSSSGNTWISRRSPSSRKHRSLWEGATAARLRLLLSKASPGLSSQVDGGTAVGFPGCGPQLRLTPQRILHVQVEKRSERGQLARPPSAFQPRHTAVPPGRSHRPHGLHGRAVKRPRPVQHTPDTSYERSERCLCPEPG
ncbi:unnamed protein product [Rangifer tarandus platyrhynchus]|uniref:Uncharacterized protein n=1 Tax=Rangifer tarandus platyrhynchus TaxID=3082113 RepID=A0ABN8ZZ21_RANTA|nr:unnamed protein product [Rangifer tarandus platyrhynchus]